MDQNNGIPTVRFEEDQWQRPDQAASLEPSKTTQWILRHSGGLLKTETQVTYALIASIAVMVILMGIILFSGGGGNATFKAPPGQKILYPANAPPRLEKL